MSKRLPGRYERSPRDFYVTPAEAVLPLVPHLRAARVRRFAEPCCGDGALVRHLEFFGLVCAYAGDIATGQDALTIPSFDSTVIITNPPFSWKMLRPLLDHFIARAPAVWLLLPLVWTANKRTRRYMARCSDAVTIGRARWIEGSNGTGTDDYAWLRFDREHRGPTIFHTGDSTPPGTRVCPCGDVFRPARSDARFCSTACKQRAYRERLAVTEA